MSTAYVKAVFDFATQETGEICLECGDVVQVLYDVDDNWVCGKLYGRVGNFPRNFVAPLCLPVVYAGQKVFTGIKDFPAQVDGDLGFLRGDLIVGVEAVDHNWWRGQACGQSGIFPVTHVQELEVLPSGESQNAPHKARDQSIGHRSPGASSGGSVVAKHAKGYANMDLTAQLDDELSFYKGDIIEITDVIDNDFAQGRCNNKVGSFPLAFVDLFEGSLDSLKSSKSESRRNSKFDWWKDSNSQKTVKPPPPRDPSPVTPSGAVYSACAERFGASEDTDNHMAGSARNLNIENTVAAPMSPSDQYVETDVFPPATSPPSHKRVGSYTERNTFSASDGGVTPYGKTLFPFVAENPNELTVFDNEIVTLIRHVDEQWIEGEIDGKTGIFPSSYVKIIVDCPYDYSATPSVEHKSLPYSSAETVSSHNGYIETFSPDTFGCVLYDFTAENPQDLAMREGDTVMLLGQVDGDWYQAKNDDGKVGLCPVSFVEIIPAEPPALSGAKNGLTADDVILTNNNVPLKLKEQPKAFNEQADSRPVRPEKPKVLTPKPVVKPKPTLKPKPSSFSTSQPTSPCGEETILENKVLSPGQKPSPQYKPPRPAPAPFLHRGYSSEVSLDDIIQTELNLTKKSLSKETGSCQNLQVGSHSPQKSPSFVEIQSSTMSVSFNKPVAQERTSASTANSVFHFDGSSSPTAMSQVQQPPPIPDTKRVPKGPPPKRAPPPRPHAPQALSAGLTLDGVTPLGPRPVPQRSAPPRPSGKPVPAPRTAKRCPDDLMEFSPEAEAPSFPDHTDENTEVIQDLERRIQEAQTDLQTCTESRDGVEQQLSQTDEDTAKAEMAETLEFYAANISGLKQEIAQLKEVLCSLQPERASAESLAQEQQEADRQKREEQKRRMEELRVKHRETRHKVIAEIIQTEKDFLESISLCFETVFHTDTYKCSGIDIETLLGNMDEVIEVSQKILNMLEAATNGKTFEEQNIGKCFVDLRQEMKRVYAPYCRNHDDVCNLLAKYDKEPEIQACFNEVLDTMRQQMSVFDIGSVLIKPVQRILKYPLLVNELIKCTEDDHLDKPHLLEAIDAMTDVAAAINEFKRRKDLVLKYKNTSDTKFSEKMSRLNMHSTKKKLQRLSQKMVGIQTIDDNFNREEKKFKNLDAAVRALVRDVSAYVDSVQASCMSQEAQTNDLSDYYDQSSIQDVQQFCKIRSEIAGSIHYRFKEDVEIKVITPLNRLLMMFQGPAKVIKKRYDKLLDYDNLSSRLKNMRESEQLKSDKESLQMAKNNYAALNAQLLDELPKLYELSLEVVQECVCHVIQAQRDFYNRSLEEMYKLLGHELVLGDDMMHVVETFNINHTLIVEQLSDICFIPKAFNPRVEERKSSFRGRKSSEAKASIDLGSGPPQSDSQRAYLRQQYLPEKLFYVAQAVGGSQTMDLELAQGTMVGVIKEGDPMGNKEHWFVDTGDKKGFVYKQNLTPVKGGATPGLPPPEVFTPSVGGGTADIADLLSFSPPNTGSARGSPAKSPIPYSDAPPTFEQTMGCSTWYTPSVSTTTSSHTAPTNKPDKSSTSPSLPSQGFDQYFEDDQSEPSLQSQSFGAEGAAADVKLAEAMSNPASCYTEELYQAVYMFKASTPLEMDVEEGETLRLVQQHDLDGNNDWWLMENEERQGYVPANYLYKLQ